MSVYDAIVRRGLAFHEAQPPLSRRAGQGAPAYRSQSPDPAARRQDRGSRFISDSAVPFTDGQAEQDIRMMTVKMKISGGFRTWSGAETFATLRSVLATVRKQGRDILQALTAPSPAPIQALSG